MIVINREKFKGEKKLISDNEDAVTSTAPRFDPVFLYTFNEIRVLLSSVITVISVEYATFIIVNVILKNK